MKGCIFRAVSRYCCFNAALDHLLHRDCFRYSIDNKAPLAPAPSGLVSTVIFALDAWFLKCVHVGETAHQSETVCNPLDRPNELACSTVSTASSLDATPKLQCTRRPNVSSPLVLIKLSHWALRTGETPNLSAGASSLQCWVSRNLSIAEIAIDSSYPLTGERLLFTSVVLAKVAAQCILVFLWKYQKHPTPLASSFKHSLRSDSSLAFELLAYRILAFANVCVIAFQLDNISALIIASPKYRRNHSSEASSNLFTWGIQRVEVDTQLQWPPGR